MKNKIKIKICSKCNIEKNISEFYFSSPKYRMSECKECFKIRAQRRHNIPEIKEKNLKRRIEYYRNNTKHCHEMTRKWDQEHVEYTRLRARISYYKKQLKLKGVNIDTKREKYGTLTIQYLEQKLEKLRKTFYE